MTGHALEWPSYEVALSRRDLERVEPRERDLILELDSWLWGGERPEPVERRQPADAWLLDDYTEDSDA